MRVDVRQESLREADAALVAVGLFDGDSPPKGVLGAPGAADAKGSLPRLSPASTLGSRSGCWWSGWATATGSTRRSCASSRPWSRARRRGSRRPRWPGSFPPHEDEAAAAEAIVTGTILGAYRFDRFKGKGGDVEDEPKARLESLTLLAPAELAGAVETARVYSEATNRARDLQETPANFAEPEDLAEARRGDRRGERLGDRGGPRRRGRSARRAWAGLVAVSQGGPVEAAPDRAAPPGRRRRSHARPDRQGGDLRHRRHRAEARRLDAGDEVRHVRWRRGARGDGGDRGARPADRPDHGRPGNRRATVPPARQ